MAFLDSVEVKLLYFLEDSDNPEEEQSEKDDGRGSAGKARVKLEQFCSSFSSRQPYDLEVREGDVVSENIIVAKLDGVDLIVMSCHGYKG